MSSTPIAW